ncbi:MAG: hypothetical protein OXS28_18600 [Gammaproteobacteria bacterium]|nr:hypothetical protein [Gammaproteobacteria bacterium]
MNWTPICLLPNIDLDEPVESDFLALVPSSDSRVQEITKEEDKFHKFLECFTDPSGKIIHPALILQNKDFEGCKISSEFIAYFRDIIVASTVPYSISRIINGKNGKTYGQIACSNYFSIYSGMISNDYEWIIVSTPAFTGLHNVDEFKGQSSPESKPVKLLDSNFDQPLLHELLCLWIDLYKNKKKPEWKSLALFRSLNMANQALLIPANADAGGTIYDYGRTIALWVSAFEILIHPGGNGDANTYKVFALLDSVPWIDKSSGHKRFNTRGNKRRNLGCWIYDQMYTCRNNFLHGNPVGDSDLNLQSSRKPAENSDPNLRSSRRRIYHFAPILYRLALTAFLNLS